MIHYLYYKAIYAQRKLARRFFLTKLYESKVGIKSVNSIFNLRIVNTTSEFFYVNTKDLFLEFDGLKDPYTLCDTPIAYSPHLFFLKAIQHGEDLEKTDYIQRCISGTIDMRSPRLIDQKTLVLFKEKFHERRQEVLNDTYKPIAIYKKENKYYIADGKHRAAMCVLLGIDKIKCVDIGYHYLEDSFHYWIYERMKKKPTSYQKNINFLDNFYNNQ